MSSVARARPKFTRPIQDAALRSRGATVGVMILMLALAYWRLWRPGSGWAKALCIAGCSLAVVGYAVRIADGDFPSNAVHTRGVALSGAASS